MSLQKNTSRGRRAPRANHLNRWILWATAPACRNFPVRNQTCFQCPSEGDTQTEKLDEQPGDTRASGVSATAAPHLRTRFIQVRAAGVHVLRHDDESQEVRGGERAGVPAAGGSREESKTPFRNEERNCLKAPFEISLSLSLFIRDCTGATMHDEQLYGTPENCKA